MTAPPSHDPTANPWPHIIGVLDLLDGQVVRAVGGRRNEYRPIVSPLVRSAEVKEVALAYRNMFGLERLYLADLTAIGGDDPCEATIAELVVEGFTLAVDAGVSTPRQAERLLALGVTEAVIALETLRDPATLAELIKQFGPQRLRFSIDLQGGQPLGSPNLWGRAEWPDDAPRFLADQAIAAGFEKLLLLDLQAVGSAGGPVTATICEHLHKRSPGVDLWSGGGVRTLADIRRLIGAGVQGVLIASALHDGGLNRGLI